MGAGIVECDVTFTKDKELVCRHSQCDLHTTTNILATPLAAKCTQPFAPATFDANGNAGHAGQGRVLHQRHHARRVQDAARQDGRGQPDRDDRSPSTWAARRDSAPTCTPAYDGGGGTLLTHAESIELFKALGVKMTPELKSPSVTMPFDGFTQEDYAQKMIDEYKEAGVPPRRVWAQSFNKDDVLYWVRNEPAFGKQAVYLDDANLAGRPAELRRPAVLHGAGHPHLGAAHLRAADGRRERQDRALAGRHDAKAAGLDIITWTLERSGILADGTTASTTRPSRRRSTTTATPTRCSTCWPRTSGVLGIFSDWPATVTYYANCMGRRRGRR